MNTNNFILLSKQQSRVDYIDVKFSDNVDRTSNKIYIMDLKENSLVQLNNNIEEVNNEIMISDLPTNNIIKINRKYWTSETPLMVFGDTENLSGHITEINSNMINLDMAFIYNGTDFSIFNKKAKSINLYIFIKDKANLYFNLLNNIDLPVDCVGNIRVNGLEFDKESIDSFNAKYPQIKLNFN